MKKFMKFCGCTAFILLIIGLVLWGIGSLYAGPTSMSEMVDKLTEGKISLDINGIQIGKFEEFLEENAVISIDDSSMFDKDYPIWKGDVEKTKVADGTVKELDIELGGSTFDVAVSEDDAFYMEYQGTGKSQAYVEDNELHIVAMNNTEFSITINDTKSGLILYVPAEAILEEISIDLGAGQMKLDGLKAKEMQMDIGAGQILADGLQADDISFAVGAGEIALTNAQLKQVKVEVGAGNCEIQGTILGDVDVECAMGNVSFALAGKQNEFNYEIQCVSGNITIGEDEYSGLVQEQSLSNNASKTMDLECAMGNLEVNFEE